MKILNNKYILSFFGCWIITYSCFCQIKSGVITYERKVNLVKKFENSKSKKWIGDKKIKLDYFELHFNGNKSLFKPSEIINPTKNDWVTSRNTVYQNLNNNTRISIYSMWGESVYVGDSIVKREWKITDRKRVISGYECRRAIWEKDDTTKIYAWFSNKIVPSTGPETFNGLPGTILGLATEDGGVVYFAKNIKEAYVDPDNLKPSTRKKEIFKEKQLRDKLEKRAKSSPWMSRLVNEVFAW